MRRENISGQKGSVVVISLVIATAGLILLSVFFGSMVAERRRIERSFRSNQAFYIAEAGEEYGI